eukprot:798972-Ditylum_brightwellii.AAC.1
MPPTLHSGKCCSGSLCTHPNLQLCKEHTCFGCKGAVHVVCGLIDETLDKYWCKLCTSKCATKNDKTKSGKVCASCGVTDHLRKSSLKCPNNVKNQPPPPRGGKWQIKRREVKNMQ